MRCVKKNKIEDLHYYDSLKGCLVEVKLWVELVFGLNGCNC